MTDKELIKEVEKEYKSFIELLNKIEYNTKVKIPSLKEKCKKKYNNFLSNFFNIKNNPNFFIKSSLNQTIIIYKKNKDKNEFVLELNFISDIKTKKFIDFTIRTEGKMGKSKDKLEVLTFIGKCSKILETKKSFFIEKCFNYISTFHKKKFEYFAPMRESMQNRESRNYKIALLRKEYILNNLYNDKGFNLDYIHKDLNEKFDIKPGILNRKENISIENVDNFKFIKNKNKTTTLIVKHETTETSKINIDDTLLDSFIEEMSKDLEGLLGLEDCHAYYKDQHLIYCKSLLPQIK